MVAGGECGEKQFILIKYTLPETNVTPENRPSQKETSIPTIHFPVRTVSFREGNTHMTFPSSIEIKSSSKTKTPQTALENLPHKMSFWPLDITSMFCFASPLKDEITPHAYI